MTSDIAAIIGIGQTVPIGTHRFDAENIKRYARRFDPQPFHVDEERAKASLFGALCASGWHVCAVWMKLNVAFLAAGRAAALAEGRAFADYGPSPGLRDVVWKQPVFAGETLSYFTRPLALRERGRDDGFQLLTVEASAENSDGRPVMRFNSAVLVRVAGP